VSLRRPGARRRGRMIVRPPCFPWFLVSIVFSRSSLGLFRSFLLPSLRLGFFFFFHARVVKPSFLPGFRISGSPRLQVFDAHSLGIFSSRCARCSRGITQGRLTGFFFPVHFVAPPGSMPFHVPPRFLFLILWRWMVRVVCYRPEDFVAVLGDPFFCMHARGPKGAPWLNKSSFFSSSSFSPDGRAPTVYKRFFFFPFLL